jgi:hypothetical protein
VPTTSELVMVQISRAEGRLIEQKKAHYRAIAGNPATSPGIRRKDALTFRHADRRQGTSIDTRPL